MRAPESLHLVADHFVVPELFNDSDPCVRFLTPELTQAPESIQLSRVRAEASGCSVRCAEAQISLHVLCQATDYPHAGARTAFPSTSSSAMLQPAGRALLGAGPGYVSAGRSLVRSYSTVSVAGALVDEYTLPEIIECTMAPAGVRSTPSA